MTANPPSNPAASSGHESRDANVRWIVRVVVMVFVMGLAVQIILSLYLTKLKQMAPVTDAWRPLENAAHTPPSSPEFPRLQVSPSSDLRNFRTEEEMELNSYGWINRTSGVVRVPIERAMDLVLQEGLPVRAAPDPNQLGPSTLQLVQQRPDHREPEIKGDQ